MYVVTDEEGKMLHWAVAIDEGDAPSPHTELGVTINGEHHCWTLPLSDDNREHGCIANMLRHMATLIERNVKRYDALIQAGKGIEEGKE